MVGFAGELFELIYEDGMVEYVELCGMSNGMHIERASRMQAECRRLVLNLYQSADRFLQQAIFTSARTLAHTQR